MKNFTFKLLAASLMLLCGALTMQAEDFVVDGIAYNITSSEEPYTVKVTYKGEYYYSDEKYSGSIFIPSSVTYDGITYSVTEIGRYAFYNCESLTSIKIPSKVTKIGSEAFRGCKGLTSIEIPEGVTEIGYYAFYCCKGLTSIEVSNDNTVYDSREDCNAIIESKTNTLIAGCKTTIIPNSVTKIGDRAFSDCTGLTSIEIPKGVTEIVYNAFRNCTGLTSIVIPESVTKIRYGAFEGTAWYDSQPDGVVYAGKVAYRYKGTMPTSTTIKLKDDTKGIADYAFKGCTGLTSITIPESVTEISERAFEGCTGLTSIEIPKGITEIGEGAFFDCESLTSIVIPESVTEIGRRAFSGCTGLTSIKVVEGNPVYDSREDCNAIIETKTNTLIAGCKTTIIPSNVTEIGGAAFYGCTGLTSIEIPEGVTKIGDSAFFNCTGLTSIKIPKGVTEIGSWAFYDCTGLTSIVIPESVTEIGYRAFSYCTGLNSITCESANPPTFGYDAFNYVDKSIPIYVPQKSIEEYNNADGWKEFTNIQCIKAEPVEEEIEETITEPQEKSVTITWPIAEGATSYKIVLTKDGETVCTITFSETGELLTIEYVAPTTKSAELRDATASVKGFRYEIKNLKQETQYSYTVTTYGASESVIREDSGAFTTLGGITSTKETADVVAELKAAISISDRTIAVDGVEASDVKVYNPAGQRVSNPVPSAGVYIVAVGSSAVKVMVK